MELKNEKIISRLISHGVEFILGSEWIGEGDDRRCVERPDKIERVFVPLTSDEWCSLCMREGDQYIGGCCGQTGHTQDLLNGIFRDGGWIEPRLAFDLIEIGGGHDGFDLLTEQNEDTLVAAEANWNELYALDKIFLCVAAAIVRINRVGNAAHTIWEEPEDGIDVLEKALRVLKYTDMFAQEIEKESGQLHGNMRMWLARAVPGVEKFKRYVEVTLAEPWNGFAIVDQNDEIQRNGYGYTIYSTNDAAKRTLEIWYKQDVEAEDDRKNKEINNIAIKPIQISSEGVTVLSATP